MDDLCDVFGYVAQVVSSALHFYYLTVFFMIMSCGLVADKHIRL